VIKRKNEGRNKGFCCGQLENGSENKTIWGRWLKKGHQNFLEMKWNFLGSLGEWSDEGNLSFEMCSHDLFLKHVLDVTVCAVTLRGCVTLTCSMQWKNNGWRNTISNASLAKDRGRETHTASQRHKSSHNNDTHRHGQGHISIETLSGRYTHKFKIRETHKDTTK